MRNTWSFGRLSDLAEVVMGTSPPGSTVNSDFLGLPLSNGPTEFTSRSPVAVQFTTKSIKSCLPGDLLFCVRGSTTGRMNWADREYSIGRGLAAIRHRNDRKLQPFIRALIENGLPSLLALATGSTFPSVSKNDIEGISISIPPINEQYRIADILGSLDDKIELNRRMNETLEAMARRLFKSWFVDFDPVHAKARIRREHPNMSNTELSRLALPNMASEIAVLFPDRFEDSSLGPIPKDWISRPLYDVAKFVNGAAFKNSDFCDPPSGRPVIKIAELKSGITNQTKFSLKDVGVDREINRGDLIYSWSGSPDTSLATFRWAGRDGLLNQHIFNVITESRPQTIFVYYLLTDLRNVLVEIARDKQTTGLGHVTVADMKRLQIVQPPQNILDSFESVAGSLYDLSFNVEVDSTTLQSTRDRLLPRLLSGELFNSQEVA